jgi:transposase
MSYSLELTEQEASELDHAYRSSDDRRFVQRCQAILMVSRGGRKRSEIARDLAISSRTLRRWIKAYVEGGIDGLRICWHTGRERKIPPVLGPVIEDWVKKGPAGCGLDRANWTYGELTTHLFREQGIDVGVETMRRFCCRREIRPYRPSYRFLRADPEKQAKAQQELVALMEQAERGELVLLSQDEARFPMFPTLQTTLGVKGHRPVVGTWDCKDATYVFASMNLAHGRLTTHLHDHRAKAHRPKDVSKTRLFQEAFVRHLGDIARRYPPEKHDQVVLIIDNAPWHKGQLIAEALEKHHHLKLYRLPSYSPQLNVIERLWRVLRRRATHNRLFETHKELRSSLRNSIRYFQAMTKKVLSLIRHPKKRTNIVGA